MHYLGIVAIVELGVRKLYRANFDVSTCCYNGLSTKIAVAVGFVIKAEKARQETLR
jgi:hypothetical protein